MLWVNAGSATFSAYVVPSVASVSVFAFSALICLQCFDAVGWAAGRASGL